MRRFIDDESGMTMAVAMMMILLIGVMGAGLLTFVSRDLNSVLEANQGTRAQEVADAGLEAAKRHLSLVDAVPKHYETADTADNSPWYDNAADNQSGASGQTLTFNGEEVLVGIRYLEVSTTEAEARDPDHAPEELPTYFRQEVADGPLVVDNCNDANGDGIDDDMTLPDELNRLDPDACNYQNGRNYFRVTARGGTGDATRVVQAIVQTDNFGSVPLSYYASRDIEIEGNRTTMDNMSIFAKRDIIGLRPGNIRGIDLTYGDWANLPGNAGPNAHNATQRTDYQGNAVVAAGAAAPGTIEYADQNAHRAQIDPTAAQVASNSQVYGYRDYDSLTDTELVPPLPVASRRPEFAENDWGVRANQPSTKMTFPFAPPSPTEDEQAMTILKDRAEIQSLYFRVAPGSTFNIGSPPYPSSSNLQNTVMFIEFADGPEGSPPVYGDKGHAVYDARSSDPDNTVKGTIVVMNGDLKIGQNADDFQGAMIVRDPLDDGPADPDSPINCTDDDVTMDYCSAGQVDIQGWVNVQSDIKIAGSVDGWLPSEMSTGITTLVKVSQHSWRECYTTNCS